MQTKLIAQIKAARRVSTPIVAIETPDPAATIVSTLAALNGSNPPAFTWDIVRGIQPANKAGEAAYNELLSGVDPIQTTNPQEALAIAQNLPPTGVLFYQNAHRFIDNEGVAQAAWNLRDSYKTNRRTLFLLAPALTLPVELQQDVAVFREELPTLEELGAIIDEIAAAAKLPEVPSETRTAAIDALSGLAAFPAEQVAAMSATKDGFDLNSMWDRKRAMIEQTPGLSVWRGGESFAKIGGCDNVKRFLRAIMKGPKAPRGIVFIDEIEKSMAASGSDTSGVSQDFLGTLLSYMQDKNATGMIFVGPPGAAKSAIAKATGNEAGIPTIQLDLGGMKGSLVGSSEARLRTALKVVSAVTQDQTLFIATCNGIATLPPELRRRFSFGTFFFDLPTESERKAIWDVYRNTYGVSGEIPADKDWTGAEIRECCRVAQATGMSLTEAAGFIVPVAKSMGKRLTELRQAASGAFISASDPGIYQYQSNANAGAVRAIE